MASRTGTGPVDCVRNYDLFQDDQEGVTCHVCLSNGAILGNGFHAQAGFVSFLSLLVLMGIIARNYYRLCKLQAQGWPRLFRSNIDILMASIIFSDLMMALGAMSDGFWAYQRQVFCGGYCSAQGVVRVIGAGATALSTLSVAIYTFRVIRRSEGLPYQPWLYGGIVFAIWLWVLLWALVPLGMQNYHGLDVAGMIQSYYTPTPWWCFISGRYTAARLLGEYVWLWLAGIASFVLYVGSYIILRRQQPAAEQDNADVASIAENNEAAKLLWYPLAYIICVCPWSIARWASYVNPELRRKVAPEMVCFSIFALMGLFNVLLLVLTRPSVLLVGPVDTPSTANSLENLAHPLPELPAHRQDGNNQSPRPEFEGETDELPKSASHLNSFGGRKIVYERE